MMLTAASGALSVLTLVVGAGLALRALRDWTYWTAQGCVFGVCAGASSLVFAPTYWRGALVAAGVALAVGWWMWTGVTGRRARAARAVRAAIARRVTA